MGKSSNEKKRRRLRRRNRKKPSSKKDTSSKISLASLEVVNTHPDNAVDDKEDNPMELTKARNVDLKMIRYEAPNLERFGQS